MIQWDKTWIRWGIAFCIITLCVEGLMLCAPIAFSEKAVAEQEWELPPMVERTHLLGVSEKITSHLAWGQQSVTGSAEQESISWQLKGIVKVGADLLALVSIDNKISRIEVGGKILDSKIEAIEASGITVSEIDERGARQARFVKIHR
jgi:hypothetical protein